MTTTSSEQSAKPLIDATSRLAALIKLPGDWDSYGGLAPSKESVIAALALLMELWIDELLSSDIPVDIVPVPTGGIQLEWSGASGDIEIEIDRSGSMTSLIEWNDGSREESPEGLSLSLAEISDQVRRLVT